MINKNKWINSLPKICSENDRKITQLDSERWTNTIPKKNNYSSVKKYSFITILFVCGLLFVSVIKNETRNLQKKIDNLQASIEVINFNLGEAVLDSTVITSPENIFQLAKEHLNIDLVSYKKSQINKLNYINEKYSSTHKKEKNNKTMIKKLPKSIKNEVAKRIETKKREIKKLQEMYSDPKSIPKEIKIQVAKQIEEKKIELENIKEAPENILTFEKAGKWGAVQVVKAFLGMPIIPGR